MDAQTLPVWKKLWLLFFFFSSRRRHTRFDCDWSSDVCSSDLLTVDSLGHRRAPFAWGAVVRDGNIFVPDINTGLWILRSEEHTSELQSQSNLVCRLLLEKKKRIVTMSFLSIQASRLRPEYHSL